MLNHKGFSYWHHGLWCLHLPVGLWHLLCSLCLLFLLHTLAWNSASLGLFMLTLSASYTSLGFSIFILFLLHTLAWASASLVLFMLTLSASHTGLGFSISCALYAYSFCFTHWLGLQHLLCSLCLLFLLHTLAWNSASLGLFMLTLSASYTSLGFSIFILTLSASHTGLGFSISCGLCAYSFCFTHWLGLQHLLWSLCLLFLLHTLAWASASLVVFVLTLSASHTGLGFSISCGLCAYSFCFTHWLGLQHLLWYLCLLFLLHTLAWASASLVVFVLTLSASHTGLGFSISWALYAYSFCFPHWLGLQHLLCSLCLLFLLHTLAWASASLVLFMLALSASHTGLGFSISCGLYACSFCFTHWLGLQHLLWSLCLLFLLHTLAWASACLVLFMLTLSASHTGLGFSISCALYAYSFCFIHWLGLEELTPGTLLNWLLQFLVPCSTGVNILYIVGS